MHFMHVQGSIKKGGLSCASQQPHKCVCAKCIHGDSNRCADTADDEWPTILDHEDFPIKLNLVFSSVILICANTLTETYSENLWFHVHSTPLRAFCAMDVVVQRTAMSAHILSAPL